MSFVAIRLRGQIVAEQRGPFDSRAAAWDAIHDMQRGGRDDRDTWAVRPAGVLA